MNAGIEPLASKCLTAGRRSIRCGARKTSSALGSEIVTSATDDWTMFGIKATTEVLDSTWAIFASRLMEPTLDPADVTLIERSFSPESGSGVMIRMPSLNFSPTALRSVGTPMGSR